MNNLMIRKAEINDAEAIANLLFLAMEDILYAFIQERNKGKALVFLNQFTAASNNQYSFENCYVGLIDEQIVACACLYDGALLHQLRQPIKNYIEANYQANFNPEDETQTGEIYLDCLGVDPNQQGKGLGSKMIHFLIDEIVVKKYNTLGLLVDEDNPHAKKLYLNLGFKSVGYQSFVGKRLEHLQIG